MSGVLRAHGQLYVLSSSGADEFPGLSGEGRPLRFRDARTALLFLRDVVAADRDALANLRRLLGRRRVPAWTLRLDADGVLAALAARLASSELTIRVLTAPRTNYHFPDPVVVSVPAPRPIPRPAPAQPRIEPPPPAPQAEFENVEAQVVALREAAHSGAPFCEECEKARLEAAQDPGDFAAVDAEAQAEALALAAESGAPFCEECEKARKSA
jgi:hypothetical protein